jgi:hypothetical protein
MARAYRNFLASGHGFPLSVAGALRKPGILQVLSSPTQWKDFLIKNLVLFLKSGKYLLAAF